MQQEVSFIGFDHVISLFLRKNNRFLASKSAIQQNKLSKLIKFDISVQDPSKIIFNFSSYELSNCGKRLLSKGLTFS